MWQSRSYPKIGIMKMFEYPQLNKINNFFNHCICGKNGRIQKYPCYESRSVDSTSSRFRKFLTPNTPENGR